MPIFTVVLIVEWYDLLAERYLVEAGTSVQSRLDLHVLAEFAHVLLRSLIILIFLLLRLFELTDSATNGRFTIQRRHFVDLREEALQLCQLDLEILSFRMRRLVKCYLGLQVLAVAIIPGVLARHVLRN